MSRWIDAPVFSSGQVLALCLNYLLEVVFPTPYIALDYPSQITHQVFLAFIAISIYVHRETLHPHSIKKTQPVDTIQQVTTKPFKIH